MMLSDDGRTGKHGVLSAAPEGQREVQAVQRAVERRLVGSHARVCVLAGLSRHRLWAGLGLRACHHSFYCQVPPDL